jgi:hypothetical protein
MELSHFEPKYYQDDSAPQVTPELPNPGLQILPDGRSPDGPQIMPELPTLGPQVLPEGDIPEGSRIPTEAAFQVWPVLTGGVVLESLQGEELSGGGLFDAPDVDVLFKEEPLEGGLLEAPDERTVTVPNGDRKPHGNGVCEEQAHYVPRKDGLVIEPELCSEEVMPEGGIPNGPTEAAFQVWPHRDETPPTSGTAAAPLSADRH